MVVRPYQPSDFDALYALDLVCFERPFRFSRAMMRQVVQQTGSVVLVATARQDEEEKIAGFCAAEVSKNGDLRSAYLATLDVDPAFRRQGIARALMAHLEEQMAGVPSEIHLHVFQGNQEAIQFYEAIGFDRIGEERHFYGRNLHAWLYTRLSGVAAGPSAR